MQGGDDDFSLFPEATPRSFVPMIPWLSLLVHLTLLDLFGRDHPARTASCVKLQCVGDVVASLPTETHVTLANYSPTAQSGWRLNNCHGCQHFLLSMVSKQIPMTTQPPTQSNNVFFSPESELKSGNIYFTFHQ